MIRKQWLNDIIQSSSKIWKVLTRIVSITRTCHPASAILPPELAPARVGLYMAISIDHPQAQHGCLSADLPKTNGNVSGVHAVLHVVFLDFVEMLIRGPLGLAHIRPKRNSVLG